MSNKAVLVVEDTALIAVDIETMLDELGAARVVTTGGGDMSFPGGDARSFDLAVVDIRTATNFGRDLVGELDVLSVPVIFLATDTDGDARPAFSGSHDIVQKPFTYEDLYAAVARLVG